jgi:protein-disulfide isomerase
VTARIRRDVESGIASGVRGTPTLFVDGEPYAGEYDAEVLVAALSS